MPKTTIDKLIIKQMSDTLGIDVEDLKLDAHLRNDIGIDSLDRVELTMAVEQEFEITMDDESVSDADTVGEFVAYAKTLIIIS